MLTTQPRKQADYRPDIDGLRAIAVISVVIFHAFPSMLPGGFIGVDIFFVISGFLITGILLDQKRTNTFTYLKFYTRRARRLFPALATVLIASLIIGWLILVPSDYRLLGKHVAASTLFSANFVLLKESGYFDVAAEIKPLLHLWSLGIEEQFYLAWPIILTLAWRYRRLARWGMLGLVLLSFGLNLYLIETRPAAAFYLPFPRFWELAVGGLLALSKLRAHPFFSSAWGAPLRQFASWAGLLLLVVSASLLNASNRFPGWQATLPVMGTLLLIASGPSAWLNRQVLSVRWLVFIGLISYPLYLWHWPLLSFARILEGQTPSAITRLALIFTSVTLAWITYRFIESPIRHRTAHAINIRHLIIVMMALATFGGITNYAKGFIFRYPEAIQAIASYEYNGKKESRTGHCFLKPEQDQSAFTGECRDNAYIDKPIVFLWGDSHAAHLYPGLKKLQQKKQNFRLFQYTASGCPPVLTAEIPARAHCKSINNYVLAQIQELHPNTVLIAAFWDTYSGGELGQLLDDQIMESIAVVKAAGVKHIVLMGQVPTWQEPQPKVILKLWEQQSLIPERTNYLLNASAKATDDRMRKLAQEAGITFISPIKIFCSSDGCLTFANRQRSAPVAHDYGHLTDVGSSLLIERTSSRILPAVLAH